jgi:hypothetical protein
MEDQMTNRLLVERGLRDQPSRVASKSVAGAARRRPVRSVTVNLAESPLGWLKARDLITTRQFDAGEQLRNDWERACLEPSTTMRWEASPPARTARGAHDPAAATHGQLAARRRFEAATAAVGAGLVDILWRIVCAGEGMRDAERALGWPARTGRLVLGIALDRLADHYRMQ